MKSKGILLPVFSLPSRYGIGDFGAEAYKFVDFLAETGQNIWQILPLNQTSFGDSPYQSPSAYAGNPYFIDLDALVEDGLLKRSEIKAVDWGDDPRQIDYGKIYENRFKILALACERGWERDAEAVAAFERENAGWLPDYALFMALKEEKYHHMPVYMWPEKAVRDRKPAALAKVTE